jgi:hypothetical protein
MGYRIAADLTVIAHFLFILLVVFGGLLVIRWTKAVWVHLPAAAWGALVELSGLYCPLTPLENRLRQAGGEAGYSGGFIEHYLIPLIYPDGLTRGVQICLGIAVVLINASVYGFIFARTRRNVREQ